jgi:septal ring factor EnvC (AmiA/AmiB activator)
MSFRAEREIEMLRKLLEYRNKENSELRLKIEKLKQDIESLKAELQLREDELSQLKGEFSD